LDNHVWRIAALRSRIINLRAGRREGFLAGKGFVLKIRDTTQGRGGKKRDIGRKKPASGPWGLKASGAISAVEAARGKGGCSKIKRGQERLDLMENLDLGKMSPKVKGAMRWKGGVTTILVRVDICSLRRPPAVRERKKGAELGR